MHTPSCTLAQHVEMGVLRGLGLQVSGLKFKCSLEALSSCSRGEASTKDRETFRVFVCSLKLSSLELTMRPLQLALGPCSPSLHIPTSGAPKLSGMFRHCASLAIPHLRSFAAILCVSPVLLGYTNRSVLLSHESQREIALV